tara:strand:+ start:1156 stop:1425 length:270 start_codon:yes stop_codon:yes gene_type:complete
MAINQGWDFEMPKQSVEFISEESKGIRKGIVLLVSRGKRLPQFGFGCITPNLSTIMACEMQSSTLWWARGIIHPLYNKTPVFGGYRGVF